MAQISAQSSKIRRVKKLIKEYVQSLKSKIKVERVILFGSYGRGEPGKYSDIDLIIISPDFKRMDFMDRLIFLSKMRKEKFMSPGMDIFGYTKEEFERLSKESIVLGEAKEEGVLIK